MERTGKEGPIGRALEEGCRPPDSLNGETEGRHANGGADGLVRWEKGMSTPSDSGTDHPLGKQEIRPHDGRSREAGSPARGLTPD